MGYYAKKPEVKCGKYYLMRSIDLIVLILLSVLAYYLFRGQDGANVRITDNIVIAVGFIPFMLIAGLYGYLISMVAFLCVFLTVLFTAMEGAYYMSVYMVAMLLFSLFTMYFWLKSIFKTIIATVITSVSAGFIGALCYNAITYNNYGVDILGSWGFFSIGSLTANFLVSIFFYIFFNFFPDSIKRLFPLGYGYTKEYQDNICLQRDLKKTKVSAKITGMIVAVELVLVIFVSIFVMALFPDLKEMMIHNYTHHPIILENGQVEAPPENDQFKYNINNIDYAMNEYALSFDLKMLLLIMCVGVPMAAIANYYAKMRMGAPIGAISNFLDDFTHEEDEKKRSYIDVVDTLNSNTHDEISVLEDSLKSTMHELKAYMIRMEEQQRLETDLEIAKKSSEAKSSFLSNMSHEIRTPINAVLGMNEMILRESNDKDILEYAMNVKSAGNSLLSLVNDILDFSKIEAGKMDIIVAQYHLGSTINDLINMISARADDKKLDFEVNVDEHIPSILRGDEIRIKQCITNLLTNAVKYTDKGKVVFNVSYEKLSENNIKLKILVSDTGMGIKEEDLSKLFSPFERIEEIKNRTIEGTGLGMSIVKKLLALMGTRLEVKSVYGQGSDFYFELEQEVVLWEEIGDFKAKYKEFIESTEKYHNRFQAPTAKILVVDDTEMNLSVFKSLLKQTLVQIDTATSGMETLDKVKEKRYDIIFLDHRMPEMDGIETFNAMKTLVGNQNIGVPIIALTANAITGAKEEYLSYGFNDYLAKPVDGIKLEKLIEYYLPKEKIATVSIDHGKSDFVPSILESVPEDSFLNQLEDIDLKEAIKNCGGADVLEKVVKDFYISIEPKTTAIKEYLDEHDIRNFTVFVHALKSSARLVGAIELSEMAADLEELGNEGRYEEVKELTPDLLAKYSSYKEKFKAAKEESDDNKPEISIEDLEGALHDIKELVEAYDFDTVDSILSMLKEYRIPEKYQDKYLKIKELIVAVDRDSLLEIL